MPFTKKNLGSNIAVKNLPVENSVYMDDVMNSDNKCPIHTADADAKITVESRRVGVGGVYMNSQLAHDDCRRIR